MVKPLIACLAGLLCCGAALFSLNPERVKAVSFLRSKTAEGLPAPLFLRPALRRLMGLGIGLASAFAAWNLWAAPDTIQRLKLLLALFLLVCAGCIDLTECRIPNAIPLALCLGGIALLAAGFLFRQEGAFSNMTGSVLTAAVCAVGLLIAMFLSRNGIGLGDVKLVSALAVCAGFRAICGTLFFGMLLCAVAAAVLLITKKKTIHEGIPFGPFLVLGYFLTMWIHNY